MKDLLEYLVKSIVNKPDDVRTSEETSDGSVNLKLTVNPEDMGIIIGKSGQTIRAIRKLLIARAMAENKNIRVNLELSESNK